MGAVEFDVNEAVGRVLATVRGPFTDVHAGMRQLFAYCERLDPDSDLWKRFRTIDYDSDAAELTESLRQALADPKLTADYTGFYFGLDGLNMARGKGIEFGCSTSYDPAKPGLQWAYECTLYPPALPSPAVADMYSTEMEQGGLADYVLSLGYAGLALRRACETIDPRTLLGGAKERAVAWGFHDGDLLALGFVRPSGFEPAQAGAG